MIPPKLKPKSVRDVLNNNNYNNYNNYNYNYNYNNNSIQFNWTLCERAQHLAGDCRDVHSLWCETGSVIDSCLKTKKTWK